MPSCNFSNEKVSIILNKLHISVEEEKLLKEIVATIIPEGELPGARSLEVQNFIWVMIDDCLPDTEQNNFMKGLKLFDKHVQQLKNKSFISLTENDRSTILETMLSNKDNNSTQKTIKKFIETVKYYGVWGFMQSEYIMTKIMPYQLIPGSYGACEEIDSNKPVNINA